MAFADDLIAEQGGGVGGSGGNYGAGIGANKQASVSTATMTGVADVLDSPATWPPARAQHFLRIVTEELENVFVVGRALVIALVLVDEILE